MNVRVLSSSNGNIAILFCCQLSLYIVTSLCHVPCRMCLQWGTNWPACAELHNRAYNIHCSCSRQLHLRLAPVLSFINRITCWLSWHYLVLCMLTSHLCFSLQEKEHVHVSTDALQLVWTLINVQNIFAVVVLRGVCASAFEQDCSLYLVWLEWHLLSSFSAN